VALSFTLYLPPDYKAGERRPAVVWAYPMEFTDAGTAGQVSGSTNRFTTIGGMSHLFFLLSGYVVLDAATMPVVGDPKTVNDTFLDQVVASAKAAIDKADELGVIDPKRVGVGGHSYGAFMTANLLAHSSLFKAGIARSGAYNRTLTPFGFQSERRTLWEAPDMYLKVSPFMAAHKFNAPILLIHGEADNNSGTFPIQSERLFMALKGNGQNVRYVTLPLESHGYVARESIEHTLWEMLSWFDKHLKEAPSNSLEDQPAFDHLDGPPPQAHPVADQLAGQLATPGRGLEGPQVALLQASGPVGHQRTVGAAGDRILRYRIPREETAGNEIVREAWRGHDDAQGGKALQELQVRPQRAHRGFVLQDRQHVPGTVGRRGPDAKAALQLVLQLRGGPARTSGEVEHQILALARHGQGATQALEHHSVRPGFQLVEEHPGAGQSGMAAEIDLSQGGEPADVPPFRLFHEEGRLGQVVLPSDGLQHALREPGIEADHRCGVAREGPVSEGIDLEEGMACHGVTPVPGGRPAPGEP